MTAQILTVVCAWCHRVITKGSLSAGITHTICPSCVDWTMACRANPETFFERMAGRGELSPPPGYFGDLN